MIQAFTHSWHRFVRLAFGAARRLNQHSALAVAGMAGPVVLFVCDLVAGLGAAEYSFVSDSISSLALTRLGFVLVIGFMAIGLLVEIFVAGLLYNVMHHKWFHLGIALLVFVGFSLLLVGAFRTDPVTLDEKTTEGIIHGLAALVVFWGFPLALITMLPSLRRDHRWQDLYTYTIAAAVAGFVLALLVAVLKDHITWFGLLERLLVVNLIIWVEVAGVRMLVNSLRRT